MMAEIGSVSVSLFPKERPCIITEQGKEYKAMFHSWGIHSHPTGGILVGEPQGQISYMTAIIEIESGDVMEVRPSQIRFINAKNHFEQFYWGEE